MDPDLLLQDADFKDSKSQAKQKEAERAAQNADVQRKVADRLKQQAEDRKTILMSDMQKYPDRAESFQRDLETHQSQLDSELFGIEQKIEMYDKQYRDAAEEAKQLHEKAESERKRARAIQATIIMMPDSREE